MPTTAPTTLTEIIRTGVKCALSDTYHMLPGIVQAYYPSTFETDVQIAVNDPRFDPDTDALSTEPWPVYPHVRVAWPRFGGMIVAGFLSKGDKVEVMFQDLDDSQFRTSGQQSDPARTRRFGSDAAFCLPWDLTDAGVATDATAAATALVLGKDGAQTQIRINGTTIQLGATGGDFVALASKVTSELNKIKATLLTGSNSGGPVAFATPYVPGTVGSTVVAAQ